MTLDPTDNLIVQRDSDLYKTTIENMATIQDDDLLLIGRGSDNYKITGKDFKEQTGGGGVLVVTAQLSPVNAYVGAVVTCYATADEGTPPYGFNYTWEFQATPDGDWTTIASPLGDNVTVDGTQVGGKLRCTVLANDDAGRMGQAISNETDEIVQTQAPVIQSVDFVEQNPGTPPRFED